MTDKNPKMKTSLSKDPAPDTVYEQIWNIQEAINKAAATGKVVRFKSKQTNDELRKGIVDKKNCQLLKPNQFSDDIAVVPPGINNFDFNEVDTSQIIWTPSRRIIT
ncbi:hypothetical protein KO465_04825 [Candidatus Micrarchaeota archaeon]|nr:hypothetical protein [Candidatus Micrarchaeota archaeon]